MKSQLFAGFSTSARPRLFYDFYMTFQSIKYVQKLKQKESKIIVEKAAKTLILRTFANPINLP